MSVKVENLVQDKDKLDKPITMVKADMGGDAKKVLIIVSIKMNN